MRTSDYIVLTVYRPTGFRNRIILDEAEQLPFAGRMAGFCELVLAFAPSELAAAKEFAVRTDLLRQSDSFYQHVQIGVAFGPLPDPLPKPPPADHETVVEAFKIGLSPLKFLEEFVKIEQELTIRSSHG